MLVRQAGHCGYHVQGHPIATKTILHRTLVNIITQTVFQFLPQKQTCSPLPGGQRYLSIRIQVRSITISPQAWPGHGPNLPIQKTEWFLASSHHQMSRPTAIHLSGSLPARHRHVDFGSHTACRRHVDFSQAGLSITVGLTF